jgi:hypothetical protein
VAAQTYLLTTQLEPGNPREHMHQAAIKSLGLVEDKLMQHSSEKKSTYYEDQGKKVESTNPLKAKQATHQATKPTRDEHRTQGIL